MTTAIAPAADAQTDTLRTTAVDRLARRLVLAMLGKIRDGTLVLVEGRRRLRFGAPCPQLPRAITLTVAHPRFYTRVVFGGSIGLAEAYMQGLVAVEGLTDLVRLALRNQALFATLDAGWARLSAPLYRLYHRLRRNTVTGSRANILAHYDLGNEFYRLFLDETLTYSCGIFEKSDSSLKAASLAKYDRICRKLQLSPADHVVEIGSGWGGFCLYAAATYGCRVTTTTISERQYALVGDRIRAAGLSDRVQVLKKDYRHLSGRFDKLVSIEMIEAVGHHYYGAFFDACSRLLAPDGMLLLQAITIRDQVFEAHARSVDFIKRYIFPGSCIPSVAAMVAAVARHTDMKLFHLEDITPHYVRTLAEWRRRFLNARDEVARMGFSDAFVRMWEFYLCYCEGGFAERYIGDVQMLFTKPDCRRAALLPPLERSSALS